MIQTKLPAGLEFESGYHGLLYRLEILQINDTDTLFPVGRAKTNNLPRVAALVNKIRAREKNVLFVHSGGALLGLRAEDERVREKRFAVSIERTRLCTQNTWPSRSSSRRSASTATRSSYSPT